MITFLVICFLMNLGCISNKIWRSIRAVGLGKSVKSIENFSQVAQKIFFWSFKRKKVLSILFLFNNKIYIGKRSLQTEIVYISFIKIEIRSIHAVLSHFLTFLKQVKFLRNFFFLKLFFFSFTLFFYSNRFMRRNTYIVKKIVMGEWKKKKFQLFDLHFKINLISF